MMDSGIRVVACQPLQDFVREVFVRAGMPPEDAAIEADVILWASLRGVDSHGIQLLPWYMEAVDIGHMKVRPDVQVIKETPATLFIDADHAFGGVVTVKTMNQVMEKARNVGIGWAFIRKTNHQGAMGYYPWLAARNGMAGISWVCGPTVMTPFGSTFSGVSNNPIAMAAPAGRHRPMVLDMAMSVAAAAKLLVAKDKGLAIPNDWALDKNGKPTTDPWEATVLQPIAGPKGSGLSIMLECLGSIIVDFPIIEPVVTGKEPPHELGALVGHPERIRRHLQNSVVMAINIGMFADLDKYKETIDSMIDGFKGLPKAEGFTEVFVPGEPEWRTYDDRMRKGIPIPEKTAANLRRVGERFGMQLPDAL